jgi:predicted phosphodiesterase
MRLGILADIHGHAENLKKAIALLTRQGVDKFVVLGDVIYDRGGSSETVAILKDVQAVGVWGNHELAVAVEPDDEVRALFSDEVVQYLQALSAHCDLGDVLLSHTLPNVDAYDPTAYYLAPRATDADAIRACFAQFGHRIFLTGHLHGWLAANQRDYLPWNGRGTIKMAPEDRYLFVIHAVMYGFAALLDTGENVLVPMQV